MRMELSGHGKLSRLKHRVVPALAVVFISGRRLADDFLQRRMHPWPPLNRLQSLGQVYDARKRAWPAFAGMPSWEGVLRL